MKNWNWGYIAASVTAGAATFAAGMELSRLVD